jgi:hypothetical protein
MARKKIEEYVDVTEELASNSFADKLLLSMYGEANGRRMIDLINAGDEDGANALAEELEAAKVEVLPPVVETADERFVRRINEAQATLGGMRISPMTRELLQAACDNVAKSTGVGIEDKDAQQLIQDRAALFSMCGCDLNAVIDVLSDNIGVAELAGQVYSTCFAVQKAANFIGNMKYRKALDAKNGEGTPAHDHREVGEPPCGLGEDGVEPLQFENTREHIDTTDLPHHDVLRAMEELHVLLQLLPEAHGWDADAPMPYLYVPHSDGTFSPVYGAEHALDIMEVRSKESRARRTKRQSAGLQAALAGARRAMKAAVSTKAA